MPQPPDARPTPPSARDLVDSVDAIIWQSDPARSRHSLVSAAVERLLGIPPSQWQEEGAFEASLHPEDRPRVLEQLRAMGPDASREVRYRVRHADGRVVDVRDVIRAVDVDGERVLRGVMVLQPPRRLGTSSDSDALRRPSELPAHDVLTGLSNRAAFTDHLAGAVARAERHPEYLFAVLALDLDRFEVINEGLGHRGADEVLSEVGARLASCLRGGDVAARIRGDEFAILLDDLEDVGRARAVASRIQERLAEPYRVDSQDILTTCSIGFTLSTHGYRKAEDALRDAVTALHRAQARGGASVEAFSPSQHEEAVLSLRLETDLRLALQRQEFRVHYQPIVRLDTGRIDGFEALVRWEHPERGLVPPAEFIPFTEDSGLVLELGLWTLDQACRQVAAWQDGAGRVPAPKVSVNLSPRQFRAGGLVAELERIVKASGLPPRQLRLEITEGVLLEGTRTARARLEQLRALGIEIQVDDFGTGYSSLAYLQQLPLDSVKLDKAFVQAESAESQAIVGTIVSLARTLGLDVVAEGVETAEQLAHLRALDCGHAQGYFFSQPLAAPEAEALLAKDPQW